MVIPWMDKNNKGLRHKWIKIQIQSKENNTQGHSHEDKGEINSAPLRHASCMGYLKQPRNVTIHSLIPYNFNFLHSHQTPKALLCIKKKKKSVYQY